MPPITDPALLEQIKRQQSVAGPPPQVDPQPFPGAKTFTLSPALRISQQNSAQSGASEAGHLAVAQDSDAREGQLQAPRLAQAQADAEKAKLELRKERLAQGLDPDTGKPSATNTGQVGEAAMANLDDGDKAIVKGILTGRVPVSQYSMSRNPKLYQLTQIAFQVDPGADLTTFAKRQAAFNKFVADPKTPMARVNQALQHLGLIADSAAKLNNAHSNAFTNPFNIDNYLHAGYLANSKDPAYTTFAADREAAASELAAAFQGSGQGGALADREHWKQVFSAANSPEAFQGVIKEAVNLLGGRIETAQDQFKKAVGDYGDVTDLMSPKAREVFNKYSDQPLEDTPAGTISNTTKTLPIPQGLQDDHEAFLAQHPRGTLTPAEYIAMRQELDKKYSKELGGWHSDLNMDDVKKYVDAYNNSQPVTKIPGMNVPLSDKGVIPGTHFLSEKDRASAANSDLGMLIANAANAGTMGLVDAALPQDKRDAFHEASNDHYAASMTGDVLGSLIPTVGLEKAGSKLLDTEFGQKLLAKLTPAARTKLVGNILVNTGYGAVRGFNAADDGQGLEGLGEGAAGGAVGGVVGAGVTKGVTPLIGASTKDMLSKLKGVDLTTLQRLGLGTAEDDLAGVPLVHGALQKSTQSFNKINAQRALSNVDDSLGVTKVIPKGVKAGTETNNFMNQQLNNAYEQVKPMINGSVDKPFNDQMTVIKAMANTPEKKGMLKDINDAVKLATDENGHYDGNGYKAASQKLRYLTRTWSQEEGAQGSVAAGDMARAAELARKNLQNMVARQQPDVGNLLKGVERGWAHSVQIEDASNRAIANDGVYSPGQLLQSQKKLDTSARKGFTARGKAPDQQFARAAADVMGPDAVPRKISLKETGIVGAALGFGAHATGLGPFVASVVSGAYGPGVKRVVQAALTGTRPAKVDNDLVRNAFADFTRKNMTGK